MPSPPPTLRARPSTGVTPEYAPHWAIFLDVDGTLLQLQSVPDAVSVDADLRALLQDMRRCTGGALALVSGRAIADLDRLFGATPLAVAGQHGAETRDAHDQASNGFPGAPALKAAADALARFVAAHPGLLLEDKGRSVALHYRRAPQHADAVERAVWEAATSGDLGATHEVLRGSMVWEIKPRGIHKGVAVETFMQAPPFAGRIPVFVGDDVTDEAGFMAVQRAHGHGIKVGAGETAAQGRLADVAAVRAWLRGYVDYCKTLGEPSCAS